VVDDSAYANINAYETKSTSKDQIFMELGEHGFEEVSDGYNIFFVSENSDANTNRVNGARNIRSVKVAKNLASSGEHKWLTSYATETVSRLKHNKIADNKTLLIFEVWTENAYSYTAYMIINDDLEGEAPKQLCHPIRLAKSDDIVFDGVDSIKIFTSSSTCTNCIQIYEFKL
jgi:hypothetical protein